MVTIVRSPRNLYHVLPQAPFEIRNDRTAWYQNNNPSSKTLNTSGSSKLIEGEDGVHETSVHTLRWPAHTRLCRSDPGKSGYQEPKPKLSVISRRSRSSRSFPLALRRSCELLRSRLQETKFAQHGSRSNLELSPQGLRFRIPELVLFLPTLIANIPWHRVSDFGILLLSRILIGDLDE